MLALNIHHSSSLDKINTSLQVGDLIYARGTHTQTGAGDMQVGNFDSAGTGTTYLVGVLREIKKITTSQRAMIQDSDNLTPGTTLIVDNDMLEEFYTPSEGDFLMFSKYSQGDSGVLGYFAKARLVNDSKEKAEIFAISSEVIINSK